MEIVRRGIQWRIGDGTEVDIWNNNWLPRVDCMKPVTPKFRRLTSTTVSDLITVDHNFWNEARVRDIFWDNHIEWILQIPLSYSCKEDTRIWHYTPHGC